jgi:hypothetical protein
LRLLDPTNPDLDVIVRTRTRRRADPGLEELGALNLAVRIGDIGTKNSDHGRMSEPDEDPVVVVAHG